MDSTINKDFLWGSPIDGVYEEDYETIVPQIVNTAQAFDASCFQGFIIADFYKRDYIYVSKRWWHFYPEVHTLDDFTKLMQCVPNGFSQHTYEIFAHEIRRFYDNLSPSERLKYTCSFPSEYEWNGAVRCLHHRDIPLKLSRTGKIWLSLCLSFPAVPTSDYPIFMEQRDSRVRYVLDLKQRKWVKCDFEVLDEKEQVVVSMALGGASIQTIALQLGVSEDCVKTIRRRLFGKYQAKNMQELLLRLMNSQMVTL